MEGGGAGEQERDWGWEGAGDFFLVPAPSPPATPLQLWEGADPEEDGFSFAYPSSLAAA